uniref:Uncharacterized protein n=1 Tax=Panagrolaimus davidi TaxID=227884 RepID=A0A914QHV6_9BILA
MEVSIISLIFALFLHLFCAIHVFGKKHTLEPDPLYEAWKDFAELQKLQSVEVNRDFPVDDRLYSSLKKCGNFEVLGERMTENLQPTDIEIYSEIGHLTTFCRIDLTLSTQNITVLNMTDAIETFKNSCLESMQIKSNNPTLPKILAVMGANLRVIESNVKHKNLASWTKSIIHMIEKVEDYHLKWKMIVIAPGLFVAHNVKRVLKYLITNNIFKYIYEDF